MSKLVVYNDNITPVALLGKHTLLAASSCKTSFYLLCNILIGTYVFRKKKNGYAVCIFIHLHAGWFKLFLRNALVPT